MPRQARRLVDLILDRTLRPSDHARLLGEDLPLNLPHSDLSPAMVRLWATLRALQSQSREVSSVEVRHDLSLSFRRVAGEYMDAVAYSQTAGRNRRDRIALMT